MVYVYCLWLTFSFERQLFSFPPFLPRRRIMSQSHPIGNDQITCQSGILCKCRSQKPLIGAANLHMSGMGFTPAFWVRIPRKGEEIPRGPICYFCMREESKVNPDRHYVTLSEHRRHGAANAASRLAKEVDELNQKMYQLRHGSSAIGELIPEETKRKLRDQVAA